MKKTITIHPVTRIEGHAKITIQLDDDGRVTDSQFHVTQVRGFEKFCEGRPYYEMPAITSRICGICPISHALASSKACDAIMAVRLPPAARKLRELLHMGQIVQSHALNFFHLSAPDLLLGMDSDPEKRNIVGIVEAHPNMARDGIGLRTFGQTVIEKLAGERVHPSWVVPGGVSEPLTEKKRDEILKELPEAKEITRRTLSAFKSLLDGFQEEVEHFGTEPTMHAGLVDVAGGLQLYDGSLRFVSPDGELVTDQVAAENYGEYIDEKVLPFTYLKAPYFKALGAENGVYRVGPLARLNVADRCGTPDADAELAEYRQRFPRPAQSSFLFHYARLIETLHCLERMDLLLNDPEIVDTHVRARATVNSLEGVGMAEAPRGTLIHHYKVSEEGAIEWVNLIIATGHNNLAINKSIGQVSRHYVDGNRLTEGMLNRVQAVVRAYDPCLSCSTHALGLPALQVQLLAPGGRLLDEVKS